MYLYLRNAFARVGKFKSMLLHIWMSVKFEIRSDSSYILTSASFSWILPPPNLTPIQFYKPLFRRIKPPVIEGMRLLPSTQNRTNSISIEYFFGREKEERKSGAALFELSFSKGFSLEPSNILKCKNVKAFDFYWSYLNLKMYINALFTYFYYNTTTYTSLQPPLHSSTLLHLSIIFYSYFNIFSHFISLRKDILFTMLYCAGLND